MEAFRRIYKKVADSLSIDLPNELKNRTLEIIILPVEDQTTKEALETFLAYKDKEALEDLDTDFFSQERKQIPERNHSE